MIDFANPWLFPTHAVAPAGPLPRSAKRISTQSADGTVLEGVFIPASDDDSSRPRTLILGFGGNAWNAQDAASYLHDLFPDCDTAVYFYRGYAPSEGAPSLAALTDDAPLVFDAAIALSKSARTVAVGMSIGSAVASHLATKRKLDGLILITPFDSLCSVAQDMMPWIPIGPLLSDINAAELLSDNPVPVAIAAAARDELVATRRTDALRARVANLVFDRTIERADHNSIYTRTEFQLAMREALDCLVS